MAKMRAVQVPKAGAAFELVERDIPEPGHGQVRIKVEACGVCHSDAITKFGVYSIQYPRVPGHEIAGRVDALGAGVTPWRAGERVGVGWHGGHCFVCSYCRKGLFLNCEQAKITGITHDGGYAEYVVVPAESVARIPDGLGSIEAGPLLCAGVTTYNSLRNVGARAGDTVAVQGIGGLGHLGIQYAAKMGFRTVALSRGKDKEALARQLGAHEYVDTAAGTAAEGLQKLGGADVVLCTAPSSDAMADALNGLKPRGVLLVVAAPRTPMSLPTASLLSGKRIAGWPSGTSIDSEETMIFSALAGVRPRTETMKLERAEEAFARVMDNKARFRVVLTP
jgi:D-arabinose 1-dehydrogenase-like Zn-dependent alcohol dehydrogenase